MAPGLNGSNPNSSKESGSTHATGGLGTIPKKCRKKIPSQSNTDPMQPPPLTHQIHPQSSQQFLPWIHQPNSQQSSTNGTNGQFTNGFNIVPNSNGLLQTSGFKNVPKNQVGVLALTLMPFTIFPPL